jgi:hypothetical protein
MNRYTAKKDKDMFQKFISYSSTSEVIYLSHFEPRISKLLSISFDNSEPQISWAASTLINVGEIDHTLTLPKCVRKRQLSDSNLKIENMLYPLTKERE